MKFARAATGRPRLLSCDSSFHGVTLGPLSIVGDEFFKEGSARCCPDAPASRSATSRRLEAGAAVQRTSPPSSSRPIQGRLVTLPPAEYAARRAGICAAGTALCSWPMRFRPDSVAPGSWFALERWGLEPDIVLVGKALSGGYMPVAAMVTRRDIYQRAVGTLERSYVHQSTYGRNRLSMAAGLATLRVIERDRLVERAAQMGTLLTDGLGELRPAAMSWSRRFVAPG